MRPYRNFIDVIRSLAEVGNLRDMLTAAPKIPFYYLTFILMVIVPTIASSIYLAWIASDQYVVESRFAVRNIPAGKSITDDLKSVLSSSSGGLTSNTASQDAYIVAQYARSRTAIEDVSQSIDLRSLYTRPDTDFVARLSQKASIEDLTEYWRDRVYVSVDSTSGIISLFVRAFTPQDAKSVSEALLASSDKLINRLSERARLDTLSKAEEDVRKTQAQVRSALSNLRELRDQRGVLDPGVEAGNISKLLLSALSDRIRLQNEMTIASQSLRSDAPTVNTLRAQLESVDGQIVALKQEMTSKNSNTPTISAFLVRFEELEIQRIFSEKMYGMAQSALERARLKAEQKQLYLTVFVPPSPPQESKYPERLAYGFILPFIFLVFWGIFALTCAAVDDHRI